MPTTRPAIIYIVVSTLAVMAMTYFGTLAYCLINGITPQEPLMRSFEAAGIYVLGAFTGILVNTRSQPEGPAEPAPVSVVGTQKEPLHTTTS